MPKEVAIPENGAAARVTGRKQGLFERVSCSMRQIQNSFEGMKQDNLQWSLDFIRKYEPPEGYYLGFSGGKDSVVLYELSKMSGVKFQAYYSATGIDPPEVVRFIRKHYPDVIFLYPKMTFWEGIRKKSPPLRVSRWCCDVLKKNPSKDIPLKCRLLGIRAEESFKRSIRPNPDNYNNRQTLVKPIFNWLEWEIWEFIENNNLAYCELYDEGFDRIGCIICPFISGKKVEIHKKRWPKQYQIYEKCVHDWWNANFKDQPMLHRLNIKTADDYIKFIYNG